MDSIDIRSEAVKCKIIPSRFNLLKAENLNKVVKTRSDGICELTRIYDENGICEDWLGYMEELRSKRYALVNHGEKAVKIRCAVWSSRYHERGQARQKSRIKKALGHYFYRRGVMLTLTFDHKKFSRLFCWSDLGYKVRDLIDRVNKYRESRGLSKIKGFLHVNEDQAGSGYPAPHIVFPGLGFLADSKVIEKLWGYGFIKVNVGGSVHPASYACKYISKMKGKDFMMAMMWFFKVRSYTFSRVFKYRGEDRVSNGWEFLRRGRGKGGGLESLEDAIKRLMDGGYYIFNIGLLRLKVVYVGGFDSG